MTTTKAKKTNTSTSKEAVKEKAKLAALEKASGDATGSSSKKAPKKAVSTTTKITLLDERAQVPTRAHESDTGYDLKMIDVAKVDGDTIYFRTGISVEPPQGHYFEVYPRSSISKLPLSLANSVGIIDSDYRGEILIPVRVHHQNVGFKTKRESYPNGIVEIWESRPQSMLGLARLILMKKPVMFQMVLRQRLSCDFKEESLSDTERGEGGFGSTDSK